MRFGYIYGHFRNDDGTIFYVGKSIYQNNYHRSKSKDSRNPWWHHIVNKVGYTIKIICDNIPEDSVSAKEIELISFYGRRDLGTGPLVNMTSGGEGASKPSQEAKDKSIKTRIDNGTCRDPEAPYELINPNGDFISGCNLKKFALENDLKPTALLRVFDGLDHSYKGYKSSNPAFHRPPKEERLLISPTGEFFYFSDICEFCIAHNLTLRRISRVLSNKIAHHLGWTVENPYPEYFHEIQSYINKFYKPFELLSPERMLYQGNDILKFCEDNELRPSRVLFLLDGISKNYKGWTNVKQKNRQSTRRDQKIRQPTRRYKLVSPNGEHFVFNNINEFAKEHGLGRSGLCNVLSNKIAHHRGWTLEFPKPEFQEFIKIYLNGRSMVGLFHMESPEGVIYSSDNVKLFAKEHNLPPQDLFFVLKGSRQSCKGWRKARSEDFNFPQTQYHTLEHRVGGSLGH